jgi:hypothetical protein
MKDQKAVELSKDYLIAIYDPSTKKIEWRNSLMMEVKTKAVEE